MTLWPTFSYVNPAARSLDLTGGLRVDNELFFVLRAFDETEEFLFRSG